MHFYLLLSLESMTSHIRLMINCIWGQVLQWLKIISQAFTFALTAQSPLTTISWHSALPACFLCAHVVISDTLPLFTIAKLCNQLKCPSSRDCIRKMKDICTVGFYFAIKKKLNYVIWAKLERNIPHGVKQTQSNIFVGFLSSVGSGLKHKTWKQKMNYLENEESVKEGRGIGRVNMTNTNEIDSWRYHNEILFCTIKYAN